MDDFRGVEGGACGLGAGQGVALHALALLRVSNLSHRLMLVVISCILYADFSCARQLAAGHGFPWLEG